MSLRACPNCGARAFLPWSRREEIQKEVKMRGRFIRRRIEHRPEPAELMDLTRFMHGRPSSLLCCAVCGLITRDDSSQATYSTDLYDRDLMEHLYPRYLRAFHSKERNYRNLLRPHAEVIEVGSHTGAFLQTAEEWNWRPTGFDIGSDTAAFSASRGLRVRRQAIEDARFPPHSADAIFIWNCFEQLENPGAALKASRALLKPRGLLVVRIPNVEFYRERRRQASFDASDSSGTPALRELAYNNLLGFPYLIGYTPAALLSLLERYGLRPQAGFNSTLLTMPFAELTARVRREEASAYGGYRKSEPRNPAALDGPWIEITCRPDPD